MSTALVPLAGPAAGAAAAKPTVCEWYDAGTLSPGISMKPTKGVTYSTRGETGKISCNGRILGRMPSGPGTIGFEARMGMNKAITCTSGGTGDYASFFTFPTADGKGIHGIEYGTFKFGLKDGKFGGTGKGSIFTLSFVPGLLKGTCDTAVTKVSFRTTDAVVGKGSAASSSRGRADASAGTLVTIPQDPVSTRSMSSRRSRSRPFST